MIEAQLLGTFKLVQNDTLLTLPTLTPSRTLLAYLLVDHAQPRTRSQLAYLLAPDSPEDRARRTLSQALWDVRRVLPDDFIVADRDTIKICTDVLVTTDLAQFNQLSAGGSEDILSQEQADNLRQAVSVYAGDLLAEFYDDWIIPLREAAFERYLQSLRRLMDWDKRHGAYPEALNTALQLLQADPLREAIHREIMRLYVALDRPEAALQQYETCKAVLLDELAVEPDAETQQLYVSIKNRRQRPLPLTKTIKAPVLNPLTRMPLVGRMTERTALLQHIDALAKGEGGLVFITGEPGLGKSHLMEQVAQDAVWRGMTVTWGYNVENDSATPFQALTEALDDVLTPLRVQQIRTLVADVWLQMASRLLNGLTMTDVLVEITDNQQQMRLMEALLRVTVALGTTAPLIIIIEDIHWSDVGLLDMLAYYARRLRQEPVLIFATYRDADARQSNTVWDGITAIDAAGIRQRLDLHPLDATQTAELISVGLGLADDAQAFSQRLYQDAKGNPLRVLQTLRLLHDEGTLRQNDDGTWETSYDQAGYEQLPVPQEDHDLILRRVKRLDATTQNTLQIASVLGTNIDFMLLDSIVDTPVRDTLQAIATLVQRQFLQETPDAYRFIHDTVREVVYSTIPQAKQRQLHAQIAADMVDLGTYPPAVLAYHFTESAQWQEAFAYHKAAAEVAQNAYAMVNAARHYASALVIAEKIELDADVKQQILFTQGDVLYYLSDWDAMLTNLEAQKATGPKDSPHYTDVLRQYSRYYIITGQISQALEVIKQALDQLDDDAPTDVYARLELVRISALRWDSDFEKAEKGLLRLLDVLDKTAYPQYYMEAVTQLANIYNRGFGRYTEAIKLYQEAIELDASKALWLEALRGIAATTASSGDVETGVRLYDDAIEAAIKYGDRRTEVASRMEQASFQYDMGKFGLAYMTYEKAMPLMEALNIPKWLAIARRNHAFNAVTAAGDLEKARTLTQQVVDYAQQNEDENVMSQALSNLGQIAMEEGDLDSARRYFDEGIALAEQSGDINIYIALIWHRTLLEIEDGNAETADDWLAKINVFYENNEHDYERESFAFMAAFNRLLKGQPQAALQEAKALIEENNVEVAESMDRVYYQYSLILRENGDLEGAKAMMQKAYDITVALRQDFPQEQIEHALKTLRWPRRIKNALELYEPVTRTVTLARDDAPSRGELSPQQQVTVTWTLYEQSDEAIASKRERRQHRLLRLLREAAAQGGAPTVEDLADVLETSAITIKRDLAALRDAGHHTPTRGSRDR